MSGLIDAVLARPDGRTISYFFAGDQYIEYDWSAPAARDGRRQYALDGVHSIAEWGFPISFAAEGSVRGIDAALAGRDVYTPYGYLFRGNEYVRYRWAPPGVDPAETQSIALWDLPTSVGRIDAAFNGALNRARYGYFVRGSQYYRYDWTSTAVDANYPKPLRGLVGMPASFASGFDCACDGLGPNADKAFFFKGDRFLRFQWVAGRAEPHVVGAPTAIQGNWMGVVELLAAARAKTEALSWITAAMPRVQAYAVMLGAGMPIVGQALVESALRTHFHLNPSTPASTRVPAVNTILGMLERIRGTLRDSARMIRFRTDSEAIADGSPDIAAAYTWPFPPSSATRINITRNFLQRSVRNRVSSLLHEAVHVNDAASVGPAGAPDPVHIPEWYVTAPEAAKLGLPFVPNDPGFATRYDQMSTANALHNPAAYATLVRHLFFATDNRELP